jgi:hypothetical protein
MVDNVPVTPGTGVEIATDQRPDNSHVQWNKIMVGGDGAFVPVTTNEPFPVAQAAPSAFDDGNKAVASAGTSVPLVAASTPCREVTVTAADTNVGAVVVGGAMSSPQQLHDVELRCGPATARRFRLTTCRRFTLTLNRVATK